MARFTKNTTEMAIARVLGVAFAGVLVGFGAGMIAHHFQVAINDLGKFLVGAATAALCWVATSRIVGFAEETMSIPTLSTAGARRYQPQPAGTGSSDLAAAGAQAFSGPDRRPGGNSRIETDPQEDGSIKVVLTVKGLSGKEFDVLRARAENVPGTRWAEPEAAKAGEHKLEGVIHCGNAQEQALHKLEELTGKRV